MADFAPAERVVFDWAATNQTSAGLATKFHGVVAGPRIVEAREADLKMNLNVVVGDTSPSDAEFLCDADGLGLSSGQSDHFDSGEVDFLQGASTDAQAV